MEIVSFALTAEAQRNSAVRTKGAGTNLNLIAMALSGFTDDKNSLWKEMCSSYSMELSHPYLRAMFDFLTTDSEFYNEVLVSSILEKTGGKNRAGPKESKDTKEFRKKVIYLYTLYIRIKNIPQIVLL